MSIKDAFDNIAKNYDSNHKKRIACFDDYYNLPLSVMDFKGDTPSVLDIGAGTGLCSAILLKKYPKANITLIDLSDKMMNIAKERFAGYSFNYIVSDYTKYEFPEKFDIIISALSIHHLNAKQKEDLYRKCFHLLTDGGIFVNSDLVLSPYPEAEAMFQNLRLQNFKDNNLTDEEISEASARAAYDDPSTMEEQLNWLKNAGFRNVECIYKYFQYCVLYAKK